MTSMSNNALLVAEHQGRGGILFETSSFFPPQPRIKYRKTKEGEELTWYFLQGRAMIALARKVGRPLSLDEVTFYIRPVVDLEAML